MPGNKIIKNNDAERLNMHKVRRLFNHRVARHTLRKHRHPEERANASAMAEAAIHRYEEKERRRGRDDSAAMNGGRRRTRRRHRGRRHTRKH